jgi:hypothetical protein
MFRQLAVQKRELHAQLTGAPSSPLAPLKRVLAPPVRGGPGEQFVPLTAQLTDIALFLGGRAVAGLCDRMAVTTGTDTLLRLLRALPVPVAEFVPCLGVDEFAVRRGRTYATIFFLAGVAPLSR